MLFFHVVFLFPLDYELMVNPKVFPQVKLGDIVEIAYINDEYRLVPFNFFYLNEFYWFIFGDLSITGRTSISWPLQLSVAEWPLEPQVKVVPQYCWERSATIYTY